MIELILTILYLMLPVYLANIAPVLSMKINFLNYPLDFNKKFKGKPILGSHKTWRGLFFGIVFGIAIAYLQFVLQKYPFFSNISLLDYSNYLLIGFLFGFGALFGDAVKSFFKRRVNVKPGGKFIPWDQIDYTLGGLIFISIIYIPSLEFIITALILNFLIHVIANHLAYYFRITKVKW